MEKSYEKYIIRTYGRCSKEYEDYMTTLFRVGFLPTSPNLIISINRQHLKLAIEDKLKNILKK